MWAQCTKCKKFLPLYSMAKRRTNIMGIDIYCLECNRINAKNFREKNPDYYKDNRPFYMLAQKKWTNKGHNKRRLKKYNKEYNALHRKKNRDEEKYQARITRRKALIFNSDGTHTYTEWLKLNELCGNKCLHPEKSKCDGVITKDHIIPLSEGGTDNIDNLQPLCFSHNSSKGVKIIDYRTPELIELILDHFYPDAPAKFLQQVDFIEKSIIESKKNTPPPMKKSPRRLNCKRPVL